MYFYQTLAHVQIWVLSNENGIYFWRTWEQMPPFEENRETKTLLGNREHVKCVFLPILGTWEQANLFQGNKI